MQSQYDNIRLALRVKCDIDHQCTNVANHNSLNRTSHLSVVVSSDNDKMAWLSGRL